MKTSILVACGAAVTLAAGACATSAEDEAPAPEPKSEVQIPDAGAPVVEAGVEASADGPMCSDAGWCETQLPDVDLAMIDLWPLPGRAFAIAQSPTIGIKILEWNAQDAQWRYIDDATQNAADVGTFAGTIWAPNADEVYFGVGPGYVYRGTRPVAPATAWAWTRRQLVDNGRAGSEPNPVHAPTGRRYPALGVWGTSSSDVYAWFKNTVFRLKSTAGGVAEWIPEYVADDPAPDPEPDAGADALTDHLYFVSAAGTSADDLWFSGARTQSGGACALVVRKTAAGYQRVADGIASAAGCAPRTGALMIGGAEGWLTDLHAVGPGRLVGLKGAREPVKLSVDAQGYSVDTRPIEASSLGLSTPIFTSLWAESSSLWLTTTRVVLRGADVWSGGEYAISTLALKGAPVGRDLAQVRGTTINNLWAIGDRYAFHKTSP